MYFNLCLIRKNWQNALNVYTDIIEVYTQVMRCDK